MKSEWNECCLGDVVSLTIDHRGLTPKKLGGDWAEVGYRALSAKNVKTGKIVQPESIRYVNEEMYQRWMPEEIEYGDILVTSEAPFGEIYQWNSEEKIVLSQRLFGVRVKPTFDADYIYYYMTTDRFKGEMHARATGTTVIGLRQPELLKCGIRYPNISIQKKIAGILEVLDRKIQINTEINENLLQQAQAIYHEMFVNTANAQRQTCRAEEYFDIAIGKTPPRKEHQWFTTDPSDVTWVSISDMGSCGTYIRRSSEQLTQEAVDKFNIRVIPSDTVLLSFKLTVGRIAITYGEMITNEAIAHFKTDKTFIKEYLYCYLKDFNYQTMGSTSSIATAVNSKIIKAMPFIIPTNDEISRFHTIVGPMFEKILNNQLENDSLAEMRDALLPRLMSGELDVSALDF